MRTIKNLKIMLAVGLFLAIMVTHSLALEYPKPVGYVNDYAGILTPDQVLKLGNELKEFDNKTTFEIAVVTVKSLGGLNIETYTMGLMNTWGVGKKGKDNGVMLLVAPNEKKVRIGTGSGMGQILSDADADRIIQNDIIPYFKEGNMSGGIISGTEGIVRHLSGQSSAPVQSINRQAEAQPSLSDQDIKNIVVGIFVIIFLVLVVIIVNWVWNKNKLKKESMELFKHLKSSTYNTLLELFQKTELTLATLEQNNPKPIWEKLKEEYENIDFTEIGKELDFIQSELNKMFISREANEKLHSLERKINDHIEICERIERRKNEVIDAKEKSTQFVDKIPGKIQIVKEILKHQDVSAKTKGLIDTVGLNFLDVEKEIREIHEPSNIDWLERCSKLDSISKALDNIKSKAENDIDTAADARLRGPEILKKLPDIIEKLEKKLSSSGSRKARSLFTDAKTKYEEAQRLSNGSSSNLVDIYLLAIMADSLLNQAESSHSHYQSSESSHHSSSNSSYSSRDFGGFGGGGSGGGGASGGW